MLHLWLLGLAIATRYVWQWEIYAAAWPSNG
jgi:hypothetical protein